MIISYRTLGGKTVFLTNDQANKEQDRILKENVKAAQKINPAKNAWTYWATFNAKQAKKGAN